MTTQSKSAGLDPVVFIDTETMGVDARVHDVWNIGLIEADGTEHEWFLKPRIVTRHDTGVGAESGALRVNRYYEIIAERMADKKLIEIWNDPREVAWQVAVLTSNKRLVGNVPSFDADMLTEFLKQNELLPAWHYHLCDTEALAAGKLGVRPPWSSKDLSRALGVKPPEGKEAHTALADARWAKAMYEAVFKEKRAEGT